MNFISNPFTRSLSLFSVMVMSVCMSACCEKKETVPEKADTTPGRIVPNGEVPMPEDVKRDAAAALQIVLDHAPNGVITIFGSARAKEGMASYDQTRAFAKEWSLAHGDDFPIMTGGSGGIMEAGNRGAMEAGKKSLYIASYFKGGVEESVNEYVTDGYLASSFAQRESDLVDYAAGIVCAPGGVGTSWEIFESLSKIQTRKKNPCPVILLGSKEVWAPLTNYMEHLAKLGTISPEDVDLIQLAETPAAAIAILEKHLKLNEQSKKETGAPAASATD